jgi:peptidoglycan/xylan/chitin deacetylase (PgdA/CDA1 family)
LKLKHAAIITTSLVILAGIILIIPFFLPRGGNAQPTPKIMLSFSISQSAEVENWCQELASFLNAHDLEASVFFVGQVAEQHPRSLSAFSKRIDIGSQTYSNAALPAIADYSLKLREVQRGKAAVDSAGHLSSRIFRAPFNATDTDIYSLLSRSGILADFSYPGQYNLYQNGQFIKYEADVLEGRDYTPDYFLKRPKPARPLIINFDNIYPIAGLEKLLANITSGDYEFVNASTLVGSVMTEREE